MFKNMILESFNNFSSLIHQGCTYKPPAVVAIEPSNICNFKPYCKICPLNHYVNKKGKMPLEQFQRLVSELDFTGAFELSGVGEPFIFEDFFDMVKFCKKRNKIVSTSTNGSLLNQEICSKIIDSGIDIISISMDAATDQTYKKIRPGGNFNEIVGNIRRLVKEKDRANSNLRVIIAPVMMKQNFDELLDIVDLFAELKTAFSFYNLLFYDKAEFARFEYSLMAMDKKDVQQRLKELKKKIEDKKLVADIQIPEVNSRRSSCRKLSSSVSIDYKGELRFCCTGMEKTFGKIENGNFFKVWNKIEFTEARKQLAKGILPKECIVGCVNF